MLYLCNCSHSELFFFVGHQICLLNEHIFVKGLTQTIIYFSSASLREALDKQFITSKWWLTDNIHDYKLECN